MRAALLLALAAVACALYPNPQLVTHRGSKLLCAENTIQCHQTAVALGADILELDVRSTKDGHLVVFHDKNTGRLCEHNVAIINTTLEALQQMDIGWRFSDDNDTTYPFRGKGYRVPTFVKFLNAFPSQRMSLELKDNGIQGQKSALALIDILKAAKAIDRVTVASEWCDVIRTVRVLAPGLRTASCESEVSKFFLLSLLGLSTIYHRIAGAPSFQLMQIPARSGPWILGTKELLAAARDFDIEVQYWVVNDEVEAGDLAAIGADGIITDRIDLMYPLWVQRGLRQPLSSEPTYYRAARRPGEVHKCVTVICRVLSLKYAIRIILFLVVALFGAIVRQCCLLRAPKVKRE